MHVILTTMRVYFTSCRVEYMEKKKKLLQARDSNAGFELGIAVFVAHCATHSATRYTQGSTVYFVLLLLKVTIFCIEWLKMHSTRVPPASMPTIRPLALDMICPCFTTNIIFIL